MFMIYAMTLTGVSVEAPGSSVTSRIRLPGAFLIAIIRTCPTGQSARLSYDIRMP